MILQIAKKYLSVPGILIIASCGVIVSLGACGILSPEESPSLDIETDKKIYDLNQDEYIAVQIENSSGQTIYYSSCLARELEIIDDGELADTIPFGVCYCLCPATLEPGDQVAPGVSNVLLAVLKDKADRLLPEETASYRIKYSFYEDESWGEKLSDNELRSNEFDLILPD